MPEDSELLREFVEHGSQAAFTELVNRRLGFVYSAALRQAGDPATAADITQNVFLLLARKSSGLVTHEFLGSWLYSTTQFVSRSELRAARRRRIHEHEATAMNANSPDDALDDTWDRLNPVLDEVMLELPAKDRDAILMRFFDSMPFAQIGARAGLSENSARMRVDRALEKLRTLLASRGITPTAGALGTALATQTVGAAPSGLVTTTAAFSLAGASAAGAGGSVVELMRLLTKQKVAAVVAIVAIELGVYVVGTNRLAAEVQAEGLRQNQEISRLQQEIQRLRTPTASALPANQVATPIPAPNPEMELLHRLQALSAAINEGGLAGRVTWQQTDVAGTLAVMIRLMGLSDEETQAIQAAASRALEEATASLASRTTVNRNAKTLTISTDAGPQSQEIYGRFLDTLAAVIGPERFELFQSLQGVKSLETAFSTEGLGATVISLTQSSTSPATPVYSISMPIGTVTRLPNGGFTMAGMRMQPSKSRDEIQAMLGPLKQFLPDDF